MISVFANEIAITAIMNPITTNAPTINQTPASIRGKNEHSLYSSSKLDVSC